MNPLPILPDRDSFEGLHFFISHRLIPDEIGLLSPLGRYDDVYKFSDNLFGRMSIDPFCRGVPGRYGPIESRTQYCVIRSVYNRGRAPKIFLGFIPFGDVHEGHDQSDGLAVSAYGVRPVLGGKTRAILLPENLIIHMCALALPKRQVGSALASW